MPPRTSAGILPYRLVAGRFEVLISHPGGPFFRNRQEGWWSVVKGEIEPGEDPEGTARREYTEETSHQPPDHLFPLGTARQRSGKLVHCFAGEGGFDPAALDSNEIEIEFPWKSGRMITIPELDEVRWCAPEEAIRLLNPAQTVFVDRLGAHLSASD